MIRHLWKYWQDLKEARAVARGIEAMEREQMKWVEEDVRKASLPRQESHDPS